MYVYFIYIYIYISVIDKFNVHPYVLYECNVLFYKGNL